MKSDKLKLIATIAIALAILGAVELSRLTADDGWVPTSTFHQRVIDSVASMPEKFGNWTSVKGEVPAAGTLMLKPNVAVARNFGNFRTGEAATVVFVECGDARLLSGHYPPVCYRANGWRQTGDRLVRFTVNGQKFDVMEYDFSRDDTIGVRPLQVYDLIIIPGSGLTTEMGRVVKRSSDRRRRYYGASQMQIVFGGDVEASVRDAVCQTMLEAHWAAIQTMWTGVLP